MLIIGAKGFAKEVLEVCDQNNETENLHFYDDVSKDVSNKLYQQFPVLKSEQEARNYFETIDCRFTMGIGDPKLRKELEEKFTSFGGQLTSVISKEATVSLHDVTIGEGANILAGVRLSNGVKIGRAVLIYYNSVVAHDCEIGDFVQISPLVNILGRVSIGHSVFIGAGAIVLPDLSIGSNVIIGAGSVVTKNIPDNCTLVGTPARILNRN